MNKTVGVVGLGYVGLPLVAHMAECGFKVVAYDISEEKVNLLLEGYSYIEDVGTNQYRKVSHLITPTTNPRLLSECDLISVCVPTPVIKREPDCSLIDSALDTVKDHVKEGAVVVIESTVYPGYTKEKSAIFPNAFVAFSPERVDPSNPEFSIRDIPKVLGADSDEALKKAVEVYSKAFNLKLVKTSASAEMSKLIENTYRAVNIALVNEFSEMAHALDIDIFESINAAKTKPFGFQAFYPSLGVGGHCIPVDPYYLLHKEDSYFIRHALTINEMMPKRHLLRALEDLVGNVLVLGVAYKPNVSDCRESPSLEMIKLMRDKLKASIGSLKGCEGLEVAYFDPYVPSFDLEGVSIHSFNSLEEALNWSNCVLICTAHKDFDNSLVRDYSSSLHDFCGLLRMKR